MTTVRSESELRAETSHGRTAVLLHATWCPFCVSFKPAFDAATRLSPGWTSLEVILDDEEDPLWEKLGIEIVPTVLLFDGGTLVRRLDGEPGVGLDKERLRRALATP
jgi:thioredoxin 1